MKKTYQKPQIMFEDFSLSVNIAGDCGVVIGNPSEDQCAYITRTGLNVFMSTLAGICTSYEDDGEYNGFCYHVPIDSSNLFNS